MKSTLVIRSAHSFKILALPLARLPRPKPSSSTSATATPTSTSSNASLPPTQRTPLTPSTTSTQPPLVPSTSPLILFHVSQPSIDDTSDEKPPIHERILRKASEQWLKLGEKDKKTWMYWFWSKGEGLMDKIEFEEWALKGIVEGQGVKIVKEGQGVQQKIEIPLLYPTLKDQNVKLPHLLPQLHRHLLHRIPYHRKRMYQALIASPFTAPFALIPVIPNFPLFYVLWRAWSHYKAWRGATYLEQLIKLGMIVEKPSSDLDSVYTASITEGAQGGISGDGEKVRLTEKNIQKDVNDSLSSSSQDQDLPDGKTKIDKAPDATSTPAQLLYKAEATITGSSDTSSTTSTTRTESQPPQTTGKGAAPDGTTTPSTQIYTSPTSSSSTDADASTSTSTLNSSKRISPLTSPPQRPRHPSLLLSPTQLPLLQKTFNLRSNEIVDITRAVEQADTRLKAASKSESKSEPESGSGPSSGDQGKSGQDQAQASQGTEWRGNLHR